MVKQDERRREHPLGHSQGNNEKLYLFMRLTRAEAVLEETSVVPMSGIHLKAMTRIPSPVKTYCVDAPCHCL